MRNRLVLCVTTFALAFAACKERASDSGLRADATADTDEGRAACNYLDNLVTMAEIDAFRAKFQGGSYQFDDADRRILADEFERQRASAIAGTQANIRKVKELAKVADNRLTEMESAKNAQGEARGALSGLDVQKGGGDPGEGGQTAEPPVPAKRPLEREAGSRSQALVRPAGGKGDAGAPRQAPNDAQADVPDDFAIFLESRIDQNAVKLTGDDDIQPFAETLKKFENELAGLQPSVCSFRAEDVQAMMQQTYASAGPAPAENGLQLADQSGIGDFLADTGKLLDYATMACPVIASLLEARKTGKLMGNNSCNTAITTLGCTMITDFTSQSLEAAGVSAGAAPGRQSARAADHAKKLSLWEKDLVVSCLRQFALDAALKEVGKEALAKQVKGRMTAQLGFTLCAGALDGLSRFANKVKEVDELPLSQMCNGVNPANPFSTAGQNLGACAKTGASACRAMGGSIDVNAVLKSGGVDGDPSIDTIASLTSAVATGACHLGSFTTQALCGTFSEAASQITKAIKTGNNDWARCAGTDRWGGCIGKMLGDYVIGYDGAATEQPVAMPTDKFGYWARLCCVCQRDYYTEGRVYDTWIKKELMGSVTENDGAPTTCGGMFYNRGKVYSGGWAYVPKYERWYKVYHKYNDCRRMWVKGRTCPWVGSGLNWDEGKRQLSAVPFDYEAWMTTSDHDDLSNTGAWDKGTAGWTKWKPTSFWYNTETKDWTLRNQ